MLQEAVNKCGNKKQQLLALVGLMSRSRNRTVAASLSAQLRSKDERVALQCMARSSKYPGTNIQEEDKRCSVPPSEQADHPLFLIPALAF